TRRDVIAVHADPVIEAAPTCGGDGPVGDWRDVERLMCVPDLAAEGLDGTGVALAIVDTGIDTAHLSTVLDRPVTLDERRSWSPAGVTTPPGRHRRGHGTMCAFDALITAPRATLLDYPVLLSQRQGGSAVDGLLSDAIAAYARLRQVLEEQPPES